MVLLIGLFASGVFAAPTIGISSIEELQQIGNDPAYPLDGSYLLTQDIDASVTATWNDDGTTTDTLEGFRPIGYAYDHSVVSFTGVFDGGGHAIRGLVMDQPFGIKAGLFWSVDPGGEVKNLGLIGGSVSGYSDETGSLVAWNEGTVTDCYATGSVSRRSGFSSGVGGLIGSNYGTVVRCHATGSVSSGQGWHAGGLIGYNHSYDSTTATVAQCYATGRVSGSRSVAGLIGQNSGGTVTGSWASGNATGQENVAGLIGYNWSDSRLGSNSGAVRGCYATGAVSGTDTVGGLLGANEGGVVTQCWATGAVSAAEASVGGLIGTNDTGLPGYNSAAVTQCYATGAVTGRGPYVGGLIGENYTSDASEISAAVTQCYATGSVTGTAMGFWTGTYVAGLIGVNVGGAVTQCYSAGAVTAVYSGVGGLVGTNTSGTVTACYWDTQTSGLTISAGGIGKITAEMKQQGTFAGWDFAGVWRIAETVTYPYFFNFEQPPHRPVNVSPPNGASGLPLRPVLTASTFDDPNPSDTHAASQWQVRAAASPSSWTLTVFDSGATPTALTSCAVPPGALAGLTDYRWRVRYQDNHGEWSAWSVETGFATLDAPLPAPTAVAASNGAFPDRVHVTWTASVGAADFMVYRSTRPTTATATAITGWVAGTWYDDMAGEPGVEPHILYYYWVRAAANASGGSAGGFSARDSGWAGAGWALPSNYRGSLWIVR